MGVTLEAGRAWPGRALAVGSCSWHSSAKPLLIINLGSSNKKRRVSTFRPPTPLVLVPSLSGCLWPSLAHSLCLSPSCILALAPPFFSSHSISLKFLCNISLFVLSLSLSLHACHFNMETLPGGIFSCVAYPCCPFWLADPPPPRASLSLDVQYSFYIHDNTKANIDICKLT